MQQVEITMVSGRRFVALADDEAVLTTLNEEPGAPSIEQIVAECASEVMWGGVGDEVESVQTVRSPMDPRGLSGADSDGRPLPDGQVMAQVHDETWELFRSVGTVNGIEWFIRPGDDALMGDAAIQAGVDEGYRQVAAEHYASYGDEVIIRRALESTLERLLYLKGKAHDRNAEFALRRQYETTSETLRRWDEAHPGAHLAI